MKIWIETSLILGLTALAALTDCKDRRVYNKHLLCGMMVLGSWMLISKGINGFSLTGFLLPFVIHFLPFKLRLVAAGDVKLFMIIGLFTGLDFIVDSMLYAYLFGGLFAIVMLLRKGILYERLERIYTYMLSLVLSQKAMIYESRGKSEATIPFALMIHLSVLVQVFVVGG